MGKRCKGLILNVSGDEVLRYLIGRYLRQAGLTVREASTGAEALDLVAGEPPDLAVLDLALPDMSGYCLGRTLWHAPSTSSIRLLYVSDTRVADERRIESLASGGDASMTHPIDRDEFLTTVAMLLGQRRDARRGRAPWSLPSLPRALGAASPIDAR
ncbi:MAG TPA: response regulator [Polyangiaceae bacterium]|nr:response regulator [Polyangiaceae bacterium]